MAQTCMYNDENSTTKAAWQLTKRHGDADARMLASIGLPASQHRYNGGLADSRQYTWVGRQQGT